MFGDAERPVARAVCVALVLDARAARLC